MPTAPLPADIKLAIASQPTVPTSIVAFIQSVAAHIHASVEANDPAQALALADDLATDPKGWSDAIMANTPLAAETTAPAVPVPVHVAGMFANRGTWAAQQEAKQAAAKAADDKTAADAKAADAVKADAAPPPAPPHNESPGGA